ARSIYHRRSRAIPPPWINSSSFAVKGCQTVFRFCNSVSLRHQENIPWSSRPISDSTSFAPGSVSEYSNGETPPKALFGSLNHCRAICLSSNSSRVKSNSLPILRSLSDSSVCNFPCLPLRNKVLAAILTVVASCPAGTSIIFYSFLNEEMGSPDFNALMMAALLSVTSPTDCPNTLMCLYAGTWLVVFFFTTERDRPAETSFPAFFFPEAIFPELFTIGYSSAI